MSEHICEWDTCHCRVQALQAKLTRYEEAIQATHDYFILLCKRYHGKKSATGAPIVSGTLEIEEAANRAGELCMKALDGK